MSGASVASGAAATAEGWATGFGAQLLQTTLALLVVSALAVVALAVLRRRAASEAKGMRVLGRLALDPRNSLLVVEAAGRNLLLAAGDGGVRLLLELTEAEAARLSSESAATGASSLVERLLRLGRERADVADRVDQR